MAEVQRTTPNTTGRPLREIVIIASLIEKEARSDEDRPLISGVIENRLGRNMRLQIDATVNYALGSWRRLTYADYKFESAYNTYLNDGLPPGPICSPGSASLRAALDPEECDYLFYVHKGDGHHAFAVTYEEHLTNVRAYIRNDPEALRVVEEQAAEAARSVPPTPTMVVDPSATPVVPENDGVSPESVEGSPSQPAPLAPRQY
jgi:cell division protein YceG involved in septum cleavage